MKKILFQFSGPNSRFVFQNSPEINEQSGENNKEQIERESLQEIVKTERYLLKLDAVARISKVKRNGGTDTEITDQSDDKPAENAKDNLPAQKRYNQKFAGNEKVGGVGLQEARVLSVEKQFELAKTSLDQRQRHLEKLYLGTKGHKAFFEVFEKHMGRTIDSRTGLVGGIGWLLGRIGISYNKSLEQKMQKKCGIEPANFRRLYKEMQGELEKNKMQFEAIEAAEAEASGKSIEDFRKSGEYKTFAADLMTIGLSLGLNALGLGAGLSIPIIYVSPKRKAFAMGTDAVLKYMGEGVPYSEAVKIVSEETDRSVFMAHNLMRNANVLIAGPEGDNLSNIDERWENFQTMKDGLTFDKNKFNHGDIQEKSLYESIGFVIDSQGAVHLKEGKKLKSVLYSLTERMFGDRDEKKYLKAALNTLEKKPSGKMSEKEILQLNQQKVEAVKIIMERIKQENAEDFLRRSARKNPKKVAEFKEKHVNAGDFDTSDLKKKYRKRPDKMEGRIAAFQQMERFLESQKVLVNNQRDFFAIRSLASKSQDKDVQKSEVLYQGAVLSFLASFDSARSVIKKFPIVPKVEVKDKNCVIPPTESARQRKIISLLHEYYETKAGKKLNENKVLQKMVANEDFRSWMKEIGEWSKLQQQNPYCYDQMSCMEKIEYDVSRVKELSDKNGTKHEFNSVAAIAPRGQGGGIPLIFNTAWVAPQWLDIGRQSYLTTTTTTQIGTENVQIGVEEIKDPILGTIENPIMAEMPIFDTTTSTARRSLTTAERLVGDYGAVAGGVLFANTVPGTGNTKSQKRVKKDAKKRYKGVKKQARKKKRQDKKE